MLFENRIDAGRQLAEEVDVKNPEKSVIVALPRGGVPLGIELAKKRNIPFDVILSKKSVIRRILNMQWVPYLNMVIRY